MEHTTIKGQVEAIRLPPGSDGWGIVTLLCGSANERTKVVGFPLALEAGDTVECDGQWASHPKFGQQFKATEIRVVAPSNAAGAIGWLLSRMPAVGRKLATEMVERWGIPGLWTVLEHQPAELVRLRGITEERAAKIHERYMKLLPERDRIVSLKKLGLTDRQIARLDGVFGERILDEIRRDPYQVIEKVAGFGWVRADALAMKLGLPFHHPSRIRAALHHVLTEASGAGHCFVPAGRLIAMTSKLLGGAGAGIKEKMVLREGRHLMAAGSAVQRESGAGRACVYLAGIDHAEDSVAASVLRLAGGMASNDVAGDRAVASGRSAAEAEAA